MHNHSHALTHGGTSGTKRKEIFNTIENESLRQRQMRTRYMKHLCVICPFRKRK